MIEFTIKCRNCGSEKDIDDDFLEALSKNLNINKEDINRQIIRKNLKRFKCSHCNERDARLISYNLAKDSVLSPEEFRALKRNSSIDLNKTNSDIWDSDIIYDE